MNTALDDQNSQQISRSLTPNSVRLPSSGDPVPKDAEAYVLIASYVLSLVEKGEADGLGEKIAKMPSETYAAHRAFAKMLIRQEHDELFHSKVEAIESDLWLSATRGGIKDLIDSHHASSNDDTNSLIREFDKLAEYVRKKNSWWSIIKAGVVSSAAFGILLVLLKEVDNPLAAFFSVLGGN